MTTRLKVICAGSGASGKTSLLWRWQNPTGQLPPCIGGGAAIGVDLIVGESLSSSRQPVKLEIWDLAGTRRLRTTVGASYFSGANDVALFCVDVGSRNHSFEDLHDWLRIMRLHPPPTVCFLVATKSEYLDTERCEVTLEELRAFAATQPPLSVERVFATSAETGAGVRELFAHVADAAFQPSLSVRDGRLVETSGMLVVVTEQGAGTFKEHHFTMSHEARKFAASLWCCWMLFDVTPNRFSQGLETFDRGGVGVYRMVMPSIERYARNQWGTVSAAIDTAGGSADGSAEDAAVGMLGASLAGAYVGGTIGTGVGPIGTVVGAVVGSATAGATVGASVGASIGASVGSAQGSAGAVVGGVGGAVVGATVGAAAGVAAPVGIAGAAAAGTARAGLAYLADKSPEDYRFGDVSRRVFERAQAPAPASCPQPLQPAQPSAPASSFAASIHIADCD